MAMNLQILPLSEIQSFVYQKCLLPRELYPKCVLPGTLARCRDSTGAEYICNIFPMVNNTEANICWLDDTVKVGSLKPSNSGSLTSLEILNSSVQPASTVSLTFKITEKLFETKAEPNKSLLATIAKEILQPFSYVDNSFIELEELRNLGIAEICVKAKEPSVFTISDRTEIVVSNVLLQTENEDYISRKLEAMEVPRQELQKLVEGASLFANLGWMMRPCLNALIIGPSGSGKTSLCMNLILENKCNSYIIRSSNILKEYPGESEAELRKVFNFVRRFVECFEPSDPMVILIEDIDLICPVTRNLTNESVTSNRISGQLISLLDHLHYTNESSKIIVLATTSNIEAVNTALRRPGRFGVEIVIPLPTEEQRGSIFRTLTKGSFYGKCIELTEELVSTVGKHTQGFVAADIALLVHTIGQEFLRKEATVRQFLMTLERNLKVMKPAASSGTFVPVFRTDEKFASIGGMEELKKSLDISILAGLRQKAAFARFGLCLPKGVLLYGPPGCAKTTLAKCLATEANMTFIPIAAAEVYSPYVGNSEKYISKIFDTARRNSPCLVFFDEIDALVGKRTPEANSDIQMRILSTLLTEMDGIGVKLYSSAVDGNTILVVAATNRPEMIDDALMRPGRFDKLIHVPAPDYESRLKILQLHAAKMPFAGDVNLTAIAAATENFSGADVCNLCNEAAMHAFTQDIDAQHITMEDFQNVLKHQKSSLTQAQIDWYMKFETTHKR